MWFSMTLWTILASLICSTLASSSSSLHSGSYPDYDKTGSRGYSDPRWNNDYERDSKIGDLSPWSADSETLTRQILNSKSNDAALLSTLVDQEDGDEMKKKRESHSLSIVNPLDVLRQRLMLEMARRRMKENQDQIRENAVILKNLGKRAEDRTNYLRRIHVSNSEDFDV